MFANRYKELELLNSEYFNERFAFTVLYGRRRVGKTTLLKEFIKQKPSIYFLVTLENFNIVLKRLQNIVADFLQDNFLKNLVWVYLGNLIGSLNAKFSRTHSIRDSSLENEYSTLKKPNNLCWTKRCNGSNL